MRNPTQTPRTLSGPRYAVERKPYRGVRDTVQHMVDFIRVGQTHPDVRNYAIQTVSEVYPHDYASEVAAIFYETCRRLRYMRDPANAEMLHEPQIVLRTGAGDCDDFGVVSGAATAALPTTQRVSTGLGAVAAAAGSPVQVVTAGFESKRGEHSHTFVRVWDSRSGAWIVLDTVAGPHTAEMISRVRGYRVTDVPTGRGGR